MLTWNQSPLHKHEKRGLTYTPENTVTKFLKKKKKNFKQVTIDILENNNGANNVLTQII